MRGEDHHEDRDGCTGSGSPPHARGRLPLLFGTSFSTRDHPRMRGEDLTGHVRRREPVGITPACAGKTNW